MCACVLRGGEGEEEEKMERNTFTLTFVKSSQELPSKVVMCGSPR